MIMVMIILIMTGNACANPFSGYGDFVRMNRKKFAPALANVGSR